MAVPDFAGTLGGNTYDSSGESSVTLGGDLTPAQFDNNSDIFSIDPMFGFGYTGDLGFGSSGGSSGSLSRMFDVNENWADYDPGASPMSQEEAERIARGATAKNSSFFNTPFGKLFSTVINFTPAGRAFNVGKSMFDFATNPTAQTGLRAAGSAIGGMPGALMGVAGSTNPGASLMSLGGNMVGGPLGGQVGGYLGSQMFNGRGGTPGTTSEQPGGGMGFELNPEAIGSGLMQLYGMSQANKGMSGVSANNNAINSQMSQLADMYGPNSPYAAQLRQQLERRDAAAGRRSQYGPREVELQAALAAKGTEAARAMGSLAQVGQSNALELNKFKQQQLGQKLALLGNLAKSSGLYNIFSPARPVNQSYTDNTDSFDLSMMGG